MIKAGLLAAAALAAAMQPSFATDAPSALPAVFGDGTGALSRRVDNTHKARYIEIFLAAREPSTGQLVAACFNTMYASKAIPASQDTAPQASWSRVSMSARKGTSTACRPCRSPT